MPADAAPARVPDHVLDDLRHRLQRTRRPTLPGGVGWERGTDADYLAELVASWAEDYDYRPHEERIAALPWERAGALNVVHSRAPGRDAPAVVLLHGWPDSVLRFSRVLPLLDDVHVVVPALPGFPFADPLAAAGTSTTRMADLVAEAIGALGYDRAVVSGGDVGSSVAEQLATRHAGRVAALHLTDIPYAHLFTVDEADLSAPEQEYLAAGRRWQFAEGAYATRTPSARRSRPTSSRRSPSAAWTSRPP